MNIRNRITKLELSTNSGSKFCACKETPKMEIRYEGNTSLNNTTVPDFCERCRKTVEKEIIIVEFVKSNIPNPEEVGRS